MILSRYVLYFVLYSFIGWVWETILCTCTSHKWASRGFLYGPICPIYGFGGVAIQLLAHLLSQLLPSASMADFQWWQVFLFSFVVCTILEYTTHWLLEKLFHAYWWDYTNMPLNLHGRICLPASTCFGLAGVLLVYVVLPHSSTMFDAVPPLLIEGLSLLLVFVLSMDLTLTVTALTNFEQNVAAMEERINQHMEQFVASLPGGKAGVEAAVATEREAYSGKTTEELVAGMRSTYRGAVQRVKGYLPRKPKKGKEPREYREHIDQLRIQAKEYLAREKEKAKERAKAAKAARKQDPKA